MRQENAYQFGPFRLGSVLCRGSEVVPLTPKAFRVLRVLIERADTLVEKDELWAAAWPGVIVTEGAMTVCIAEIRKALGDSARNSRYVVTVHKRGYRFVAPIKTEKYAGFPTPPMHGGCSFVGRQQDIDRLWDAFSRLSDGRPQMVLVTGEAGIGKTTLTNAFMARVGTVPRTLLADGICVDQYGIHEPYFPLIEALKSLYLGERGRELIPLLTRHAPMWLLQLPGLLDDPQLAAVQSRVAHATPERMMRELADFLHVASADYAIVLRLEDIQWSDAATLAWLAFVIRRAGFARLLIIATCREPPGAQASAALASLRRELSLHELAEEHALGAWTLAEIGQYVEQRLAIASPPRHAPAARGVEELKQKLVAALLFQTGGNPLYVASMVKELLRCIDADGSVSDWPSALALVQNGRASGQVVALVTRQLTQLAADDRRVLEAASVAGMAFTAAAVARLLAITDDEAESRCAEIARSTGYWRCQGSVTFPGGVVSSRYAFGHNIYRTAIFEQIPPGRAAVLHRAAAAGLAQLWAGHVDEVAAQLAWHSEEGGEPLAAAAYLLRSGDNALRRAAYAEAAAEFERGIKLLTAQAGAGAGARHETELALQLALAPVLASMHGSASDAAVACYRKAASIATELERPAEQFAATYGLRGATLAAGALLEAHAQSTKLLALATAARERPLLLEAHVARGNTAFQIGSLREAREHLDAAWAMYEPQAHREHARRYGMDPGMFSLSLSALVCVLMGDEKEGVERGARALAHAASLEHAYSVATAYNFAAWLGQLHRDVAETERRARSALEIARRHGFLAAANLAAIRLGWALVMSGQGKDGMVSIEVGIRAWRNAGLVLGYPYFLGLLADCHLQLERPQSALDALRDGLRTVRKTGEHWIEPELLRLRGVALERMRPDTGAGLQSFKRAVAMANAMGATHFCNRALFDMRA